MRPQVVSLKKQAGLTLIEMAIVIVMAMIVILGGMKIVPEIQFSLNSSKLTQDINEIRTASLNWKASRPSFDGVAMSQICGSGRVLLAKSICGVSNDGTATAPWGGDYTVTANAGDKSILEISVDGLPNHRIFDLGDTLAALTRDRCTSVTGCASATVSGESITPGYTADMTLRF
ncbi:prepilin-type N-terminal cleavage/methylation domain-containing protein [Vibrio owensii]|uniref:prepilin-type N-terminal cleavage/methylation domain-containing protein n=1 Tax=Vibrio owensii TaxID=696485 RepID=UPI0018F1E3A0|nr:prepilin-type N-terminal cleavage/methylation domain-containing protein [Vibrio owensii]